MDIKGYLNEKLKYNEVAKKAKGLTAAVLVAGTILTGAGLTACEQKPNMSNEELASSIVNVLQEQKEGFEINNVEFGRLDNKYVMIITNTDFSNVVGYEISSALFKKLIKLAQDMDSEYIEIAPNGEAFAIKKGGIEKDDLKAFNEVIYNTIQKGKIIDLSKYIQQGESGQVDVPPFDVNNCTDEEFIDYYLARKIKFDNDQNHDFDGFKTDYIRIYNNLNLEREYKTEWGEPYTFIFMDVDLLEFVDTYSKNGDGNIDTQKIVAVSVHKEVNMDDFESLLKSKVDNEKIKRIEHGYLVDSSIFDDESMAEINMYLRKIVESNGGFMSPWSYEEPIPQQQVDEPEKE